MEQPVLSIDNFPTRELEVDINDIQPNKWNPNLQSEFLFKQEMESIKKYGFIDPILVREIKVGSPPVFTFYEIIDGEHRYKACKQLGYTKVKVLSLGEISEKDARFLTLMMNERGQADIAKRGEVLNSLDEGQLQLLPFTAEQISFEKELLNFDFSQFENVKIDNKEKDPWREAFLYVHRAFVLLEGQKDKTKDSEVLMFLSDFASLHRVMDGLIHRDK